MKAPLLVLFGLLSFGLTSRADSHPVAATPHLGTGRTAYVVAHGEGFSCAILDTAGVKCWGLNDHGQLGLQDEIERRSEEQMGDNLPFVDLGTARTASDIAAGQAHACVVLDNGAVKCWGSNEFGQVGQSEAHDYGTKVGSMGNALPIVDLGAGRTAMRVAAGAHWSCAALDDGTAKCWGAKPEKINKQ